MLARNKKVEGRDKLCSFCLYDYEHFFVRMERSSSILLATLYRTYFWRHARVHTTSKENNKAVKNIEIVLEPVNGPISSRSRHV